VLQTAEDACVPMPFVHVLHQSFPSLLAQGHEDLDWSAPSVTPFRGVAHAVTPRLSHHSRRSSVTTHVFG
jgi:hypothetical protein